MLQNIVHMTLDTSMSRNCFEPKEKLLSEEFELTANSLGAHIETPRKLILRTLSYLKMNSQDDSHCELAVNFPLVCSSNYELAVTIYEIIR